MDEKTTHKKMEKSRLGNIIRVGKLMRKWGDYQMGLLLLHFPYWISFKTREKFQSHFINYSYQMGDVSFIIYARKKVQLKSFNGIFIASGILCNFMSTILHQDRSVFFFIIKKREWKWNLLTVIVSSNSSDILFSSFL